ncbi:hypothetical protein PSPO01_15865 [Paraphaeosphaeria sporulosa]
MTAEDQMDFLVVEALEGTVDVLGQMEEHGARGGAGAGAEVVDVAHRLRSEDHRGAVTSTRRRPALPWRSMNFAGSLTPANHHGANRRSTIPSIHSGAKQKRIYDRNSGSTAKALSLMYLRLSLAKVPRQTKRIAQETRYAAQRPCIQGMLKLSRSEDQVQSGPAEML